MSNKKMSMKRDSYDWVRRLHNQHAELHSKERIHKSVFGTYKNLKPSQRYIAGKFVSEEEYQEIVDKQPKYFTAQAEDNRDLSNTKYFVPKDFSVIPLEGYYATKEEKHGRDSIGKDNVLWRVPAIANRGDLVLFISDRDTNVYNKYSRHKYREATPEELLFIRLAKIQMPIIIAYYSVKDSIINFFEEIKYGIKERAEFLILKYKMWQAERKINEFMNTYHMGVDPYEIESSLNSSSAVLMHSYVIKTKDGDIPVLEHKVEVDTSEKDKEFLEKVKETANCYETNAGV